MQFSLAVWTANDAEHLSLKEWTREAVVHHDVPNVTKLLKDPGGSLLPPLRLLSITGSVNASPGEDSFCPR